MWGKLQDNDDNIYYVGLVLKMETKNQMIHLNTASRDQIQSVIAAYNGGIEHYKSKEAQQYASQTILYYDVFKKYSNCN